MKRLAALALLCLGTPALAGPMDGVWKLEAKAPEALPGWLADTRIGKALESMRPPPPPPVRLEDRGTSVFVVIAHDGRTDRLEVPVDGTLHHPPGPFGSYVDIVHTRQGDLLFSTIEDPFGTTKMTWRQVGPNVVEVEVDAVHGPFSRHEVHRLVRVTDDTPAG